MKLFIYDTTTSFGLVIWISHITLQDIFIYLFVLLADHTTGKLFQLQPNCFSKRRIVITDLEDLNMYTHFFNYGSWKYSFT